MVILAGLVSFNSCKSVKTTSISLYESSYSEIDSTALAVSVAGEPERVQQDFTHVSAQLIDSLNNKLYERILNSNNQLSSDLSRKIDGVSRVIKELEWNHRPVALTAELRTDSTADLRTDSTVELKTDSTPKVQLMRTSGLTEGDLSSDSLKMILEKIQRLELKLKNLNDSVNALSIKKKVAESKENAFSDNRLREKSDSIKQLSDQLLYMKNARASANGPIYYETKTLTEADAYRRANRLKSDSIYYLARELQNLKADRARNIQEAKHLNAENEGDRRSEKLKADSIEDLVSSENLVQLTFAGKNLDTSDSIWVAKNDSIDVLKEKINETLASNKIFLDKYDKSLGLKTDSIQLLINQIYSLYNNLRIAREKNEISATDSVLVVAYYDMGKIVARNGDKITEELRAIIQKNNLSKVLIAAHTDISGSASGNRIISDKRIEIFRKELIGMGVNAKDIYTQSWGSNFASETIVDSERRVEIEMFY